MLPDLRVAYVGNFTQEHCTEVHVAAALEELGCQVLRLQENAADLTTIEKAGIGADLLLYTRTWGFGDRQAAIDMLRTVELAGTVTASFHLDLYLGLNRANTLDGDPFWATGWVFTPDGDPVSEAVFAERGIRHVWSPPAVHGPECYAGTVRREYVSPVCFVGSYPYPHPEWTYRNQLVEWLSTTYGAGFRRYGSGSMTIRNGPLNDLYASVGVVVGDTLCPGFTKPNYWSDRLTETLGRGGVLVWPRVAGVEELGFDLDGGHASGYTFGDFDELRHKVDWLIEHPTEAREMAARGQQYVRDHHTYRHRMAALLSALELD